MNKAQVEELLEMIKEVSQINADIFATRLADALYFAGVDVETVQLLERIARNDEASIAELAQVLKGGNE